MISNFNEYVWHIQIFETGTNHQFSACAGDSYGATSATLELVFTISGAYKMCFKLSGGEYEMVGSEILVVTTVSPTSHNSMSEIKTGVATVIVMSGGHGLSLGPKQDSAKIVTEDGSCWDSSAGDLYDYSYKSRSYMLQYYYWASFSIR